MSIVSLVSGSIPPVSENHPLHASTASSSLNNSAHDLEAIRRPPEILMPKICIFISKSHLMADNVVLLAHWICECVHLLYMCTSSNWMCACNNRVWVWCMHLWTLCESPVTDFCSNRWRQAFCVLVSSLPCKDRKTIRTGGSCQHLHMFQAT